MCVFDFFNHCGSYSVSNGIINFSGGSSVMAAGLPEEQPLLFIEIVTYIYIYLFCHLLGLNLP
jgi:hypothetical protein